MDRCALFVDAGYVLADGAMAVHGTRNRESVSWDYAGVIQFLGNVARDRTGLPLLRCYWYEATVESRRTPEHDALADLPGVKLRLGRMRPGRREGVESEIHRDLATLARNGAVSDALVVSAEEDLAQVIADVQDLGVRVIIVHITVDGNWTIARALRQECDDIVEIGEAHLRPYVEFVVGAEPERDDERQAVGAYAGRALTNGHAAIGALAHQQALPVGSHHTPPSIYTAPVIAEYQRAALPPVGGPSGAAQPADPSTSPAVAGTANHTGPIGLAEPVTDNPGPPGLPGTSGGTPAAQPGMPGRHGPAAPEQGGQPGPPGQDGMRPAQPAGPGQAGVHASLPMPSGPGVTQQPPPAPQPPGATDRPGPGPATPEPSSPGMVQPGLPPRPPSPQGQPDGSQPAHQPAPQGVQPPGSPPQGPQPPQGMPSQQAGVPPQQGIGSQSLPPRPGMPPPQGMHPGQGMHPPQNMYQAAPPAQGYRGPGQDTSGGQPGGGPQPGPGGHQGPGGHHQGTGAGGPASQPPPHQQPQQQPPGPPRPYPPPVPPGRYPGGPPEHRPEQQYPGPPGQPDPRMGGGGYVPQQGPYSGPQPATPHVPVPPPTAISLADAVQAAHGEGFGFGQSVAREAPALWLEAVLARKPRMPSDLEARLLQDSSLPIDSLLHDEVRHALRRGFWDALERSRH